MSNTSVVGPLSALEWAQFTSFPISAILGILVHGVVVYRLHHYNVQLNKYHVFVISQSVNDIIFTVVDLSTLQVFREKEPFYMQLLMHVEYSDAINLSLVCIWNASDMLRDYMIAACTMHWYFAWKQVKRYRVYYSLLAAIYLLFTVSCMGMYICIQIFPNYPLIWMSYVNYGMVVSRLIIFTVSLGCTLYLLSVANTTRSANKLLETAKRRMLISLAAKAVLIGLVPVFTLISKSITLLAEKIAGRAATATVYRVHRGSVEVIRCLQIFSPFLSGLVTFWSLREGFLRRRVTWVTNNQNPFQYQ